MGKIYLAKTKKVEEEGEFVPGWSLWEFVKNIYYFFESLGKGIYKLGYTKDFTTKNGPEVIDEVYFDWSDYTFKKNYSIGPKNSSILLSVQDDE